MSFHKRHINLTDILRLLNTQATAAARGLQSVELCAACGRDPWLNLHEVAQQTFIVTPPSDGRVRS